MACLVGVVLLAHAVALTTRVGRALAARLGYTVWFSLAASAALLAGMGQGLLLSIVAAGTADAYRVHGLGHVHRNLLGWVGLAVVGPLGAPRGDVAAWRICCCRSARWSRRTPRSSSGTATGQGAA